MKAGVSTSVVAHAALVIVAIVGLGSAKPLEPEVVESIAVELVPISELTNIRMGALDSTVVETDTPAVVETETPAELAEPTGNTSEDQLTPAQTEIPTPAPVTNTAPAPAPEPEPEPAPTPAPPEPAPPEPAPAPAPEPAPVVEMAPAEVAAPAEAPARPVAPIPAMRPAALQRAPAKPPAETRVAEAKPQPVTPAPKAAEKPKATPKPAEKPKDTPKPARTASTDSREADLDALIQNLEKSRGATTGAGGAPTLGKETGRSATLSQSQLDGLVAQIKSCMNIPAGAAEAGITAQLAFSIDAGGNVSGTPAIVSGTATPLERALASAAQRAVMRCGPYRMATGQDVRATFDPRELS